MMDFGEVGLEGLVGPENGVSSSQAVSHPETTKPESNGSGILKRGRSGSGEEEWRGCKVASTDDSDSPKTMLFHQQGAHPLLLRSNSHLSGNDDQHHNMLSFSSPRSEVPFLSKSAGLAERSTQNPVFSYYQHTPYAYTRNAGHGSGGLNAGLHPSLLGARGPFTPSQWVELEHQALIYKYIVANVPIPSNLLITLKKPLIPYGLSSGSYTSNSVGWGSFHLGYSGNTDPEPGRCRRTDGKKWRCSRDAVPDQKYCERHINRGRHRSRKPVEGRTGQAVPGGTTNVASIACSPSASVMSSSGASNNFSIMQQQFKGLQPGAENPSADVVNNRLQDHGGLSVVSATASLKSKDSPFSVPKQHICVEDSSRSEFGLVSSVSLLNPSEKSSYMNSTNSNLDFTNHESSHDQRPLHHFTNDWRKDQSNRATTVAWPEELKSDWTQLSMSIPMASDFSSTSSSSPKEKISLSPFRLSRELDPIEMGLAVNNDLSGSTQRQPNWIPISWGSSMGGPLGEALNSSKNSSALNLTTGAWTGSPQLGSSPTGVLQRTTFGSLSNSSSASNSMVDNKKTDEGGSLGDDMLGSTIASSFSIPSL